MPWKTDELNDFPNAGSYPDSLWSYQGTQTGTWSAPGDVHFSFPKPSSGLPGSTFGPIDGSKNGGDCFIEVGLKNWTLSNGIDDDMSIELYRAPQGQPDPSNTGTVYDGFLFDFQVGGGFTQITHIHRNGGAPVFTTLVSDFASAPFAHGDVVRCEIRLVAGTLTCNMYKNGVIILTASIAGFVDIGAFPNGWVNYYGFANGSVAGSQTADFSFTKVGHFANQTALQRIQSRNGLSRAARHRVKITGPHGGSGGGVV